MAASSSAFHLFQKPFSNLLETTDKYSYTLFTYTFKSNRHCNIHLINSNCTMSTLSACTQFESHKPIFITLLQTVGACYCKSTTLTINAKMLWITSTFLNAFCCCFSTYNYDFRQYLKASAQPGPLQQVALILQYNDSNSIIAVLQPI